MPPSAFAHLWRMPVQDGRQVPEAPRPTRFRRCLINQCSTSKPPDCSEGLDICLNLAERGVLGLPATATDLEILRCLPCSMPSGTPSEPSVDHRMGGCQQWLFSNGSAASVVSIASNRRYGAVLTRRGLATRPRRLEASGILEIPLFPTVLTHSLAERPIRTLNHPMVGTLHELIEFLPVHRRWLYLSIDPILNCLERHVHPEGKLPYA